MATSSATATASSTGSSIFGLAFVVLFILKVAGMAGASWGLANLSWWWVFSPIFIAFGLLFVTLFIMLVVAVLVHVFSK